MDLKTRKKRMRREVARLGEVRALVLVGGRRGEERFGDYPLAELDILGRSVMLRTVDRLLAANIGEVVVVTDTEPLPPAPSLVLGALRVVSPDAYWAQALQQYRRLASQSDCVLVIRLGAWTEVDIAQMLHQHLHSGAPITRACTENGVPLDVYVISSDGHSEAAALLRGELLDTRLAPAEFTSSGYTNLLSSVADLRTLALDAFAGVANVRPFGRELRPGIWCGKGARVHRLARVVAPAFIGAAATVRRAAVVTRGSTLEYHSEVDCGTVIDGSSVMPYTRIGAGLEVERAVVGFRKIFSLKRHATVEIADPHLVGATRPRFSAHILAASGWLSVYLPNFIRLLLAHGAEPIVGPWPEEFTSTAQQVSDSSLTSIESQNKSYREMATTRRYGNE